MVIIFKATCLLLIVATGLLLRRLHRDWNQARTTEAYLDSATPMDRLKHNGMFFFIASCLALNIVFFTYLVLCKVVITPPFE